jgi:uncharacterized protein YggE
MKRTSLVVLAATLLLVACGDTTTVVRGGTEGPQTGMVVVGVGSVEVSPDILVVALGVESTRPTAPEALDAMATAADSMIAAIRDAGIEPEDLQTTSLSVREVRPPREPVPPLPVEDVGIAEAAPAEAVVGFVGEQRLRVRIRDLDSAGKVIEAAVAAAGEDARVFNLSFEVAQADEAIAQARQRAVEDALQRGEELADTAGVDLGSPTSIEEIQSPDPGAERLALDVTTPSVVGAGGAAALTDAAAQIEPGVRRLEVRVQVRFEIEK